MRKDLPVCSSQNRAYSEWLNSLYHKIKKLKTALPGKMSEFLKSWRKSCKKDAAKMQEYRCNGLKYCVSMGTHNDWQISAEMNGFISTIPGSADPES